MIGPLGGAAVGWGLGRSRRRATPWWYVAGQTCVAAYQPIGAPSLAESYVNLAQPGTYDAAPGVAPTFDAATGWTFDGATQYLNTGILIGNNWSMLARFSDVLAAGIIFGMIEDLQKRAYIWPRRDDNHRQYVYGEVNALNRVGPRTDGIIGMASTTAYLDGVNDGTIPSDWTDGTATRSFFIGALNQSQIVYFSGKIQAVAIYSTTLSASDVAALTARMQAL